VVAGQKFLNPPLDLAARNRWLESRLNREVLMREAFERASFDDARERIAEMVEARAMAGAGPWKVSPSLVRQTDALIQTAMEALEKPEGSQYFRDNALLRMKESTVGLKETNPILAQGAYGDIELALQNVEWRREVNLSWLEFSRWGIQQIILICRLHYIKNPTIQRGINVSAQYVFGRGVEVSSPDPDADAVLKEFMERSQPVLGQVALTDLQRAKYYDGNLFFAFFSDKNDKGQTEVRTVDATEIMDVVTDPEDSSKPWFYRREWTDRSFNIVSGQTSTNSKQAWYPALGYNPSKKPKKIGNYPVMWDTPIYHRKCGAINKWHFGVPLAYAAIDWAKASRQFLEACATVKRALAQISMVLTSKGGQAALEQQKAGLSTQVGPAGPIWDPNPTPVNASIFGSGPGTTLAAFKTSGAGGDPEEVRRFELMVWRVFGIPETFGGDVKTGNLATATSLDRPTELNFLEQQEAWREDLVIIARVVLANSYGAANGMLREAMRKRLEAKNPTAALKAEPGKIAIVEAQRVSKKGQTVKYKAGDLSDERMEVMVTFPSIREGDMPALVSATVESMTLGNTQGQVVGVDEKAGVRRLYEITGIENGDEIIEEQYPENGENAYDPVRKKEEEPPPPAPGTGGAPPAPGAPPKAAPNARESLRRLLEVARRVKKRAA
jgi:hypothetical protein